MESVLGIGGIFFRSERPEELRAWYARHLGVELEPYGGATFRAQAGDVTVGMYSTPARTTFRVSSLRCSTTAWGDLDAMLAQLRGGGVEVKDEIVDSEHGRFAWAKDLEGRLLELWQPPPVPTPRAEHALTGLS